MSTFLPVPISKDYSSDASSSGSAYELPQWLNILAIGSPLIALGFYYLVVRGSRFLLATPAETNPPALNRFYKQALRFIRSETAFLLCLGLLWGMMDPYYRKDPRVLTGWRKIVAALSGFVVTETGLRLLTALSDALAQQEHSVINYFTARTKEILVGTTFGSALTGTLTSALLSMNPNWLKEILDGNWRFIAIAATGMQMTRHFLPLEIQIVRYFTPEKRTVEKNAEPNEPNPDEESQTLLVPTVKTETTSITASLLWAGFGALTLMGSTMVIVNTFEEENTALTESGFNTSAIAGIESATGGIINMLILNTSTMLVAGMATLFSQYYPFFETEPIAPLSSEIMSDVDREPFDPTTALDSDDEHVVAATMLEAKKNNFIAHYQLGIQYMTSAKLLNYAKALSHLNAAWNGNIKRAGSYLGLLYEYIFQNRKDNFMRIEKSPLEMALFLYQHADQNYTLNQVILSVCYLRKLIPIQGYMTHAEMASRLLSAAKSKENKKEDNYVNVLAFLEGVATAPNGMAANLLLALVYRYALLGVVANASRATLLEKKIMESTEADTQYNLGMLYQNGYWTPKDPEKGLEWLKLAAEQNHADALFNLEIAYRTGLGCIPDPELAQQYLEKAAEYGHSTALAILEDRRNPSASSQISVPKIRRKSKKLPPAYSAPLPTPSITQYISKKITPDSQENLSKIIHTEDVPCVVARYTLLANSLDKLSIQQNELLFVLRDEGEWLYCQNKEGRCGMVPITYLQKVNEKTITQLKNVGHNTSNTITTIDQADIEILKEIGCGGSAVVRLGFWRRKQMHVAVKSLQSGMAEDARVLEEYQRELEIIANLHRNSHPNIVTFCACTNEKPPSLIMEYMNKGTLWQYLGGREDHSSILLNQTECARIAVYIINGLSHLHDNNILHRDIKSLNVSLGYFSGEEVFAKLIDFGSAVYCEKGQTVASTQRMGSIRWQAPEVLSLFMKQLYGSSICDYSEATDIYSYGMVLWELLSHQQPYAAFQDESNIQVIEHVAVKNKREIIPSEAPLFLRDLIQDCWQTDPQERPTAEKCFQILDTQFTINKDTPWHSIETSAQKQEDDAVSEMEIAPDHNSPVQPSTSLRQSFFYHKPPRGKMISLPEPRKKEQPAEEKRVHSAINPRSSNAMG